MGPITETLTAESAGIGRAAAILRGGGLVAFPTETVYGLGADARCGAAVGKIYDAKGRPPVNPLIVHLGDAAAAGDIAKMTPQAERLAAAFWPGPLTLILPLCAGHGLAEKVTAGLGTVGLRVPQAPVALALLDAFGGPVAAPSANPSTRISPTTAAHVLAGLSGRIDAVVDGGPCRVGVESTILELTDAQPRLLRTGAVSAEDIAGVVGSTVIDEAASENDVAPRAPGQMSRHYAPRARLRLDAQAARAGELLLGFGAVEDAAENLSPSGDLEEAAANLFAALHRLDLAGAEAVAVSPIPDRGLGRALNDRLRRAAAPGM